MSDNLSPPTTDSLTIDFIGEIRTLAPGEYLTFGRSADLVVDENPFLHRTVGRFGHRGEVWWIHNHCPRSSLQLTAEGGTSASIAPTEQFPLAPGRSSLRFTGGPTTYELDFEIEGRIESSNGFAMPMTTATIDFGVAPLSANQHRLLVSLCASRLSGAGKIPTSRVAASSLGWSMTQFNRQLDHLCEKLSRAGVRGLCGDQATRAVNRRRKLVEHALESGLVTRGDLTLLWRS